MLTICCVTSGRKTGVDQISTRGECSRHSQSCGAGIGVFLLVQRCCALAIRGSRAAYLPALYLDANGEVDENMRQNKPLYLSAARYQRLQHMYAQHALAKEISRIRSTADRVIRQNWY